MQMNEVHSRGSMDRMLALRLEFGLFLKQLLRNLEAINPSRSNRKVLGVLRGAAGLGPAKTAEALTVEEVYLLEELGISALNIVHQFASMVETLESGSTDVAHTVAEGIGGEIKSILALYQCTPEWAKVLEKQEAAAEKVVERLSDPRLAELAP